MNDYYQRQSINQYTYFFVKDQSEAFNWPIAPGSLLVFKDQDNIHFYTKSLGYSPYDRPMFEVYTREAQVQEPNHDSAIQELREAMSALQKQISELKNGGA